jgi:hypothetical protein
VSEQPAPEMCAARWCERPATLQLLCGPDATRLADLYGAREGHGQPGRLIHGLPWMYEHIRLAYPSVTGWTAGNGGAGVDDPEAEKLAAVLALRTDILDHLTETARDLAERLGRHGPELTNPRWRVTPWAQVMRSAGWLLVNIESLRAGQGVRATDLAVFRLASVPAHKCRDVDAALMALDAATAREAVAAVLEEADDLASRAHALAPWRPRPSQIKWSVCRCGTTGAIHDFGDVRMCIACHRSYADDQWRALTVVFGARFGRPGGVDHVGDIDLHWDDEHAVLHAAIPTDAEDRTGFLDTYQPYLARNHPEVMLIVHEYQPAHRFRDQEGATA